MTGEAGHTPGPWFIGGENGGGKPTIVYCDNELGSAVADCDLPFSIFSKAEREANARLIAAAPDLLEALTALVEEVVDYARINNLGDAEQKHNIKLARAALSKARG